MCKSTLSRVSVSFPPFFREGVVSMSRLQFLVRGAALLALVAVSASAQAATYYWDNNGVTAGFGTAAGTWAAPTTGDGTQGWSTSSTGVLVPGSVTTAAADTLNFGFNPNGLATGTITVSGAVDVGAAINVANGSGAITLSGGTLDLAAATSFVSNNSTTGTLTIASNVSSNTAGTHQLALTGTFAGTPSIPTNVVSGTISDGTGTVNLRIGGLATGLTQVTNSANSFTGGVAVSVGTLMVSTIGASTDATSPLGVGTNAISLGNANGNGALRYTGTGETTDRGIILFGGIGGAGSSTIDQSGTGLLKFTGVVTAPNLGNQSLILQGSTAGTGEFGGAIINATGKVTKVTKAGTGTWTLSGTSTYTGLTTVNAGLLNVTGSLANNGSDKVLVASAGTVFGSNDPTIQRNVTGGVYSLGSAIKSDLLTKADLTGTATGAPSVSMAWRIRDAGPVELVANVGLISDVMNLAGTGTDSYSLTMSYSTTAFASLYPTGNPANISLAEADRWDLDAGPRRLGGHHASHRDGDSGPRRHVCGDSRTVEHRAPRHERAGSAGLRMEEA